MTELTSRKNETVVSMKKLGASAEFRRERREFFCDGEKLLAEAVKNGAEIRTVLCVSEPETELPSGTRVYRVPEDVLRSVSPMKNPGGTVFSAAMPEEARGLSGQMLVLENVQDPGNVGTVIRTANALGVETVALAGACADPFHPKTVRSTMGAIFRQRVVRAELSELRRYTESGGVLYGAALSKESVGVLDVSLSGASVAVGSEGRGLSQELLALCTGKIIIPMNPACESLNAAAAAAILLWEMRREAFLQGRGEKNV